ncbi:MAG: hypothetical protein ABEH77_07685 [Halobacteriaceae archaeon]
MAVTPAPDALTCAETERGLRATDAAGASVRVRLHGWDRGGDAHEFAARPDAVVTGTARGVDLPGGPPALSAADGTPAAATTALGDGEYRLKVDAGVTVVLRFGGPATLRTPEESTRVAFSRPHRVTVGFYSRVATPDATVRVPPTSAGLATATTHAAAALRTTGPERSLPAMRRHPPQLAFGDTGIPGAVAAATPDTDIEVRVPDSLEAVLAAAPPAYYLGASVTVGADTPRLVAPGVERSLAPLAERAPALLERVFWLDALVRDHPAGAVPDEVGLLDALDIDAAAARRASPAGRLRRYLDAPFGEVADDLPRWHLAAYVEPTVENARALPHLLDRLATVHPPETGPLPARELMERSLDDFYRGEIPTAEVTEPALADASLHGWLAPGTPIDVFTALPEAFEHRLAALGDPAPPAVTVVLNDPAMAGEETAVADRYREEGAREVTVRRHLTRDQLAAMFAEGADLLHFIGHCETEGLQCTDGFLAAADLPANEVETFFLNACGSFREGRALVRTGSVAGGVTYRAVLDEQAATVGKTFARLALAGFSVERAVRLARRRVMMGKDYAVVGDGTHSLSGTPTPRVAHVESTDGGYRLVCEGGADRSPGETHSLNGREHTCLWGGADTELDADELAAVLDTTPLPVVFDGEFYWSEELASTLAE